MKVYRDIEQGSDEWKAIRKGKPTASSFSNIITAAKGELSTSAGVYIRELISQSFCPDWEDWQGNKFTERGKEFEDEAREAFVVETGLEIERVGFCVADDGVCGCSPDSLIIFGSQYVAGLEIKCPSPKVHVGYVLDGGLPDDYKQQVHGSMAVTGLEEWHFWSYFPGMRHHHYLVKHDDYTNNLADALQTFIAEYKKAYAEAYPKLRVSF